ncbi:putative ABC transport system permease protein [Actinokineospora baliensis]|uniref:FtsX-like permease family protein n=1 Tax=Actinokineospora baliensis TaxID=547056 RepID=UPI001958B980|nr:ABC transporter permease [Actinokineospora baliensis]MBM7773188.1 putative ABC transport system permease protein [Actinokineospora baliensis]
MLSLSLQTVRTRLSGLVGAFLAVLCGTALVGACGVLIESGIRAGVPTQRYAAAAAVVGGKQSVRPEGVDAIAALPASEQAAVDAGLIDRVAAVPGVRAAVGEVDFPATLVTASGPVATDTRGHNWAASVLGPFPITAGAAPTRADHVVLDANLAARAGVVPGQRVRVETPLGIREYEVSGLAAADGLTRQSALWFAEDQAAALFGRPGQVHAIGVLGDASGVERALAGADLEVATGNDRGTVEFADVSQARAILTALAASLSGVVVLVMVFVVGSTLALSVAQRRREFALLRAIAATPKQIRALIGAETLLVTGVAGLLGAVGAIPVAGLLRDAFARIGIVPSDFELAIGPLPLVAALLLGVGAARFAAYTAGRGPSRISPVEALGEAVVERRALGRGRTVAGVIALAVGVVGSTLPLFLHGPIVAGLSALAALVIVIGVGALGPRVVGAAIRFVAGPLGRVSRVGGYLAAANSRANTRRLAAAITPLMLAVGFAVAQFFSQTTHTAAVQRQTELSTVADYVITSQSGGLPPSAAVAVREVPGVAAATPVVRTQVFTTTKMGENVELRAGAALGVDGDQVRGTVDLGSVTGDLTALTGDTVALSESQASWMDKRIGDRVPLHFGDGRAAEPRLVATYTHDLAFGDFVLPAATARAHTTNQTDSSILVRLTPTADGAPVADALRALTARFPTLVVGDRTAMTAAGTAVREQQFWVNVVAFGVVLGYIVISVANTLVMTTAQRAREFALLRLIGGTRRQVKRMMRIEALLVGGIAVVVGSLIPLLPLTFLGIGLAGNPVPSGPFLTYLGIIGSALLLGLIAITVPTRLGLRARPIDAIGLRD